MATNQQKSHSSFQRILCFYLSLSMAAVSPLSLASVTQKQNNQPSNQNQAAEPAYPLAAESLRIKRIGVELLKRARYGQAPGILGGITLNEMEAYEQQIQYYKVKIVDLIDQKKHINNPALLKHQILSIFDYFEHTSRALAIRVFSDPSFEQLDSIKPWLRQNDIIISLNQIQNLEFTEAMAKASLSYNENEIPFTVKSSTGYKGIELRLALKDTFITSFVEQKLAQSSTMDDLSNTAAYISASMMLDNYYLLQMYKGTPLKASKKIGSNTLQMFPSLSLKFSEWDGRLNWLQSVRRKKEALSKGEEILKVFSQLGNQGYLAQSDFVIGLLEIMNPDSPDWFLAGDDIVDSQLEVYRTMELERTLSLVEVFLLLSDLRLEDSNDTLASFIVNSWVQAKVSIYRSGLLFDPSVSERKRGQLETYLDQVETELRSKVDSQAYIKQISNILDQTNSSALEHIKREYRSQLIIDSKLLQNIETDLTSPADLSLLNKAFENELKRIGVTSSLQKIIRPIVKAQSYTMAQLEYHKTLNSILSDKKFSKDKAGQKKIDPNNPKEIIDTLKKWEWKSSLKSSKNPRTARFGAIEETRRSQDLINFVKIGQLYGFFTTVSKEGQTLQNLNLSPETLALYRDAQREKLLFQFPVLAHPMDYPNPEWEDSDKEDDTFHLWQYLAKDNSAEVTEEEIDRHLLAIGENIDSNLEIIEGHYTPDSTLWSMVQTIIPNHYINGDKKKFNKMVAESIVMAHRLQSHPLFFELYGEFARKVDKNSTAGNLWRTFYSNYVELGFTMLIGYQVIQFLSKFMFPRFSSFIKSMEIGVFGPYLATFMGTSMAFIGVDLINGGYENWARNPNQLEAMKGFYYSSAKGNALYNYSDVTKKEEEYHEEKIAYYWELGLLLAFIGGLSIILPLVSKGHTAYRMSQAKKLLIPKFHRIGFQNKEYSFFEAEVTAVFEASLKQVSAGPYPHLMTARVRAEHQHIINFIQKEEAYWAKLAQRSQYQFKDLGLAIGEWHPQKIEAVLKKASEDLASKSISLERYQVIKHSTEHLKKVIRPELTKMTKDPFTFALYQRIWNIKPNTSGISSVNPERYQGEFSPEGLLSRWTQEKVGYSFESVKVETPINGKSREVEIFSPVRTEEYKYDSKWQRDIEELDTIFKSQDKTVRGLEWNQ